MRASLRLAFSVRSRIVSSSSTKFVDLSVSGVFFSRETMAGTASTDLGPASPDQAECTRRLLPGTTTDYLINDDYVPLAALGTVSDAYACITQPPVRIPLAALGTSPMNRSGVHSIRPSHVGRVVQSILQMRVTEEHAEHVVDVGEEAGVTRGGGGGDFVGGYRQHGESKGDAVVTGPLCYHCNAGIQDKPYRIHFLGSCFRVHLNCAYHYWHSHCAIIPLLDLEEYADGLIDVMHPAHGSTQATGPAGSASSAKSARTNNGRGMVTAATDIGRTVQQHDGEAARSMRTMNALNLEVPQEQDRHRRIA